MTETNIVNGFANCVVAKAMEPIDTGYRMPKRNRFGYKLGVFTCRKIEKTTYVPNVNFGTYVCPLILQKETEFDFWNEFEGFVDSTGVEARKLDWNSSWLGVVVGDRLLDESTMTLYKVTGFKTQSGRSEIYYDID